jgi:hypothetical protein
MQTTTYPTRNTPARTALAAFSAALLFSALTPNVAAAMEEKCSDFTPNKRPCTATEQYGYCLTNAAESYETCKEDAGIIKTLGCAVALEVDVIACTVALPVSLIVPDAKTE